MEIQNVVTRKLGPLPVWAYAVIIAGVYFVYSYVRSSSAAPTGSASVGFPAEGGSDSSVWDEAGANAGNVGNGGTTVIPTTTPDSNQAWYLLSAQYLVGFSYDGVAVQQALDKYLSGMSLSASEAALVSQAIARYGVPPDGVPIPDTSTDPVPTPGRDGTPAPRRNPEPTPGPAPSPVPVPTSGGKRPPPQRG